MACKCYSASQLIHRCDIYTETKTPTGTGGFSRSWTLLASGVRSRFTPKQWKEQELQDQLRSPVTFEVLMRYRNDFDHTSKLIYDGREFNIHSVVDPTERKRWLIIKCVQGVNVGQ